MEQKQAASCLMSQRKACSRAVASEKPFGMYLKSLLQRRIESPQSVEADRKGCGRSNATDPSAVEDARCVHNLLASPSDLHYFVYELKQDHVEEFKAAWRSSVGLERFQKLLLGLLLNIFDACSRTYMIVVVVVQTANIDSEAFLEN